MKKKIIAALIILAVVVGLVPLLKSPATATSATTSLTITKFAADGVTIIHQVTVNASDLETGTALDWQGQQQACPGTSQSGGESRDLEYLSDKYF